MSRAPDDRPGPGTDGDRPGSGSHDDPPTAGAGDGRPKPDTLSSRRGRREVEENRPGGESGTLSSGEGMYKSSVGYALWCLFFVGLGGVHRIYLGKYGTGILWLMTAGLFGIGQFVDLFRMNVLVRDANVRDGYLPHPRYAHMLPDQAARPPEPEETSSDRDRDVVMRKLLMAAEEHGGAISVTQGVAATGLSFSEVEDVLTDMVASGYVDVDNHPETGVVVYRFTEL